MTRLFLTLVVLLLPAPALGEVHLSFYSRDLGIRYPHAFIVLAGQVDATGEVVDINYGWTSENASIVAALRDVDGRVSTVEPGFVERSDLHFTLSLTDAEYEMVLAQVEAWRAAAQPSYNLNERNCIHFVADIARMLGLEAEPIPGLMKRPKAYLARIGAANAEIIETRAPAISDGGAELAASEVP